MASGLPTEGEGVPGESRFRAKERICDERYSTSTGNQATSRDMTGYRLLTAWFQLPAPGVKASPAGRPCIRRITFSHQSSTAMRPPLDLESLLAILLLFLFTCDNDVTVIIKSPRAFPNSSQQRVGAMPMWVQVDSPGGSGFLAHACHFQHERVITKRSTRAFLGHGAPAFGYGCRIDSITAADTGLMLPVSIVHLEIMLPKPEPLAEQAVSQPPAVNLNMGDNSQSRVSRNQYQMRGDIHNNGPTEYNTTNSYVIHQYGSGPYSSPLPRSSGSFSSRSSSSSTTRPFPPGWARSTSPLGQFSFAGYEEEEEEEEEGPAIAPNETFKGVSTDLDDKLSKAISGFMANGYSRLMAPAAEKRDSKDTSSRKSEESKYKSSRESEESKYTGSRKSEESK
ncbi:hypothetical protein DFP72DRAFT_1077401 [Ephemerocybe angulata]|uniref:Uncharacterized protein n=1 Tax=Ephemerocybe angulata TaxID=980116 RepID=A0A8H6HG98_9AGAR|nr:hypothetical protein DFP72DRAFT_1077401 [Tulosesus angulatus]